MSFITDLENVVGKVGGALSGVSPVVGIGLEVGKAVLALVESAKTVVAETDISKLEAMREDLEPKVMTHADATEAELRGK